MPQRPKQAPIVQYVLTQILRGERDFSRLKASTLERLEDDCRVHVHPTVREHLGYTENDATLDSSDSKSLPDIPHTAVVVLCTAPPLTGTIDDGSSLAKMKRETNSLKHDNHTRLSLAKEI